MRSHVAPDYSGEPYARLMVWVDEADGMLMQDAEERFVSELESHGVAAVASHALFFPGREYALPEQMAMLEEHDVDGIVFVSCTGAWSSRMYVPESTTTQGKVNPYTGSITSTSKTYGGYSLTKPRASFTVELVDVATGDVVWVAYSETKGNAYAGTKTLYRSVADKAAGQLVEDGLVLGR